MHENLLANYEGKQVSVFKTSLLLLMRHGIQVSSSSRAYQAPVHNAF